MDSSPALALPASPMSLARRGRRSRVGQALRQRGLWLPSGFLLAMACLGVLAPAIQRSVLEMTTSEMDFRSVLGGPSAAHPLGTDHLGRDVAARLLSGARVSLAIGAAAAVITGALALVVGLASGFYGGWVDNLLMRATDTMMSLPSFFIVLVVAAMISPAVSQLTILIAVLQWMYPARLVRGEVLSVKQREYVVAAHASGASAMRILFRHVLPGVVPTLMVATTLAFAWAILTESALSYLGVGVRPPQPSWGNMLSDAQMYLFSAAPLAIYPGTCIVLTVLAINVLGDRLRDLLDPRFAGK